MHTIKVLQYFVVIFYRCDMQLFYYSVILHLITVPLVVYYALQLSKYADCVTFTDDILPMG